MKVLKSIIIILSLFIINPKEAFCSISYIQNTCSGNLSLKITQNYLILPVSQKAERNKMIFSITNNSKEITERSFVIRLSDSPEYWVFADVSIYKGKTLKITYEGDAVGLSKIYQSDQITDIDDIYKEKNRPQLHFTSRRGWINDPNGLIYYDGEYHLFYQHNPFEREWENMHWGHAVSSDLLHWEELPIALFPDEHGTMFSGTIVIDYENTSGFGTNKNPPMVAFYTSHSLEKETQCVAYSLNKGRTWTKYAKNPIIDSGEKWNTHDTRDPKVFWYAPNKHWVLVLNERDGHSIYNSTDLKNWTYQSHTPGFWECPELFELPVSDNGKDDACSVNTIWVMYGASGTYMLGNFNGKKFTPVTGKLAFEFGSIYAAQTFANIPTEDGRRIQIGWNRVDQPNMPFNGQMSLPAELTLRTTPNGIRLFANPIKEIDILQKDKVVSVQNITPQKADELLKSYGDTETLRIKTTIKYTHTTSLGLNLNGQNIIDYDLNYNKIYGFPYSQTDFSQNEISFDIILDKTTFEVFADNGGISYCLQYEKQNNNSFHFWSDRPIEIKNLEVWTMNSIWDRNP